MGVPQAATGWSDRLIAAYVRGRPRGRVGPLPLALLAAIAAVLAAAYLAAGVPDRPGLRLLAALVVGAVGWSGGVAAVRAALPGHPAFDRASVLVLTVLSDGVVVVGAAFWAKDHETSPGPLTVGFLALAGSLMVAYARTRILASAGLDRADGPWGIASREVRMLIMALGIALGQTYWALALSAALAHGAVVGHLVQLRATLRD